MSEADHRTSKSITYAEAGVDIDAGNSLVHAIKPLARSTQRPGADADLGGFGGLFDLKRAGFKDPVLVSTNDGVGTKLKIAIEAGKHNTIGIDLVAMCVNDIVVTGAEPLFFLDYFATGKLDVGVATAVVEGIAKGCRQAGAALIGGETAEMPGMYQKSDYDLAGFAVGAVERGEILPRKDIHEGDLLIGLKSSGVHSNGFSLVRRLLDVDGIAFGDPAPWCKSRSTAEALLEPTRIYVKSVLAAIRTTGSSGADRGIKAMSHITGGGLSENIPRILPGDVAARIDLSVIQPPDVFGWLKMSGNLDDSEMLRTFNCGLGMIIVADQTRTDVVMAALKAAGEESSIIGEIISPGGERSAAKGQGEAWAVRYDGKLFNGTA